MKYLFFTVLISGATAFSMDEGAKTPGAVQISREQLKELQKLLSQIEMTQQELMENNKKALAIAQFIKEEIERDEID